MHRELFRIKDHASDLLVLCLASSDTLSKVNVLLESSASVCGEAVVVVSLALYFMRLYLYAISATEIEATTRVIVYGAQCVFLHHAMV